ncbi:CHAT domain-containing protein [Streptomyces sp. NBC_01296]|uniref:CHAT domain-containing protein n=1 Tax=Streptomyces sp. NBC_01296 TaxID=2903816 RepID=UPI002E0FFA81|nr:CHAT domain-containing protein [Streptomyces sp. NBC_01296]
MSTILIQVGDHQAEGFPEDLCIDDGTDPRWFEHPRARVLIPDRKLAGCPSLNDRSVPTRTLMSTGQELYDALLSGAPGEVWQTAAVNADLRVVLDIQPGALRLLPWELLCTPAPQQRWLFEDEGRPFVRAHIPYGKTAEPLTEPVRLLVVVGDPQDGDLKVDSELDAIYAALSEVPCCWQTRVLWAPGKDETREEFTDFAPHILHFIGHGKQDALEGPSLEVMTKGDPWSLTAGYVGGALAPPLRLAVLNACRTAGEDARGLVWAVSDGFFQAGTLAVIAMQGDIASTPAVRFSEQLYRCLAAGKALDESTASARNALHYASGTLPRDWALPVLTVQADPRVILKWPEPIDHAKVARQRGAAFNGPRWLVGRARDQHRVSRRMAAAPSSHEADLVIVTGESKAGKSELIRSCILTSAWRGVPVVYVNLANEGVIDLPTMLERVARSAADWLEPESDAAIRDFIDLLTIHRNELDRLRAGMPAPLAGLAHAPPPLPSHPNQPEDNERRLILEFGQFIRNLANSKPLLLVLDHFLQAQRYGRVMERILGPAGEGKFHPVRMVAVDGELPPDFRMESAKWIMGVELFDRKDATLLVREYCARKREWYRDLLPSDRAWETFTETMRAGALDCQAGSGSFSPEEFKAWETAAQRRAQGGAP